MTLSKNSQSTRLSFNNSAIPMYGINPRHKKKLLAKDFEEKQLCMIKP